jgi:methyltransferase
MNLAWSYALIAAVAAERAFELYLARRNAERLIREKGAEEIGADHYIYIVLLHGLWLAAMVLLVEPSPQVHGWLLALYAVVLLLRWWTIRSLGPYWTTRILTVRDEPLVRKGPYRFVRHPNYIIVAVEIFLVPVILDMPIVAVVFGFANLGLLYYRIRVEDAALASRRAIGTEAP